MRKEGSEASMKAYGFLVKASTLTNLRNGIQAAKLDPNLDLEWLVLFVLHFSSQREACDPRDKVFSIRGLLDHFANIFPSPDYSESVSTVLTETAKAVITYTNSLEILRYSVWPPKWCDLPSRAPSQSTDFGGTVVHFEFNAANESEAIYRFSHNNMDLQVRGIVIRGVRQVAEELPLSRRPKFTSQKRYDHNYIRIWQQWYQMASSLDLCRGNEGLEEALC